jgi:hypothetical protein
MMSVAHMVALFHSTAAAAAGAPPQTPANSFYIMPLFEEVRCLCARDCLTDCVFQCLTRRCT